LGVFIPLIVVNCIILGRAEAFASKNGILASAWDGIQMGLGYTLGLIIMSLIREVVATGMITLLNPFDASTIFSLKILPSQFTVSMFSSPVGAFLTFALLAAAVVAFRDRVDARANKEVK
jgi:Na+-translocating ferredoxin:NAD+ oxidoreductase subunit E